MAKGTLAYFQVLAIVVSILLGLVFMQFCVNLHVTSMLFLGVLGLVGLPLVVAFIFKRLINTLN